MNPTTRRVLLMAPFAPPNLITKSEAFDHADWTSAAITVTPNAIAAPDGSATADRIAATALDGYIFATNSALLAAAGGNTYTYSVYAKDNTAGVATLLVGGAANYAATFNLSTQAITGLSSNTTAAISAVGGGWYRISITCSAVANNVYSELQIGRLPNGTSIYAWGAMLSLGRLGRYRRAP